MEIKEGYDWPSLAFGRVLLQGELCFPTVTFTTNSNYSFSSIFAPI